MYLFSYICFNGGGINIRFADDLKYLLRWRRMSSGCLSTSKKRDAHHGKQRLLGLVIRSALNKIAERFFKFVAVHKTHTSRKYSCCIVYYHISGENTI